MGTYFDLETNDGVVSALRAIASRIEARSEGFDLAEVIENLRSASSEANSLSSTIAGLVDSTISDAPGDIESASSEADDLESTLDNIISDLESLQS